MKLLALENQWMGKAVIAASTILFSSGALAVAAAAADLFTGPCEACNLRGWDMETKGF